MLYTIALCSTNRKINSCDLKGEDLFIGIDATIFYVNVGKILRLQSSEIEQTKKRPSNSANT